MLASTQLTRPDEKPGRLQLAIMEWQRQLIEMKRLSVYGADRL